MLFDTAAPAYDRSRPGYPEELFLDLRDRCLGPGRSVLEIGCGTGQATRDLARYARDVTCVEIGSAMVQRAAHNLSSLENVRVVTGAFEDVDLPFHGFDLVFSATAFHWIDPELSYPRAASLLAPGGYLALVTNVHVAGGSQSLVADDLATLQSEICPEVGTWRFPTSSEVIGRARSGGDIAHLWARIDRNFHEPPRVDHLFEDPFAATYEWTAAYDTDSYAEMLSTQSAYIALDVRRREQLLEGVRSVIDDRLGGRVTKCYVAVLAAARLRMR